MEATENKGAGILHQIIPPCLEDASLKDCALPPYSIKEAFFKAVTQLDMIHQQKLQSGAMHQRQLHSKARHQ
ncbi:hypothetical protein C1H46_034085 [Malus baccata]|uniref:Uncharacterized protein n=1 Tax=Malus baccata TaxID=106549 RepID=A0A540L1J4_MALBA|nr:hypothetical protein C1H46_034085 [Malus baccata]